MENFIKFVPGTPFQGTLPGELAKKLGGPAPEVGMAALSFFAFLCSRQQLTALLLLPLLLGPGWGAEGTGVGVRALGMEKGHRRVLEQKTDFWYGHRHTASL